MPRNIPAINVKLRFLGDSLPAGFTKLKNQSISEPIAIRQNEIVTAGTLDKSLAIIGEVLTENVANIKRKKILYRDFNN